MGTDNSEGVQRNGTCVATEEERKEKTDMWVCPVDDDASRKILAMIEFERYCREHNIETYAQHRHSFKTKDKFLHWYNCVRPHMSLNLDELETPEKAFYRKAQDIMLGNFLRLMENMKESGANDL